MPDKYEYINRQLEFLYLNFTRFQILPEFKITWINDDARKMFEYLQSIVAQERAKDAAIIRYQRECSIEDEYQSLRLKAMTTQKGEVNDEPS